MNRQNTVSPVRIWEAYPFSFRVKGSVGRGTADGAICWSKRPGPDMVAWNSVPIWVLSPLDRGLPLGWSLAGIVARWTPLVDLAPDARLPAWLEGWEWVGVVAPEAAALDAEVRLGVLSLCPALDGPFLTRTAFSSAWVRSSSSLRS